MTTETQRHGEGQHTKTAKTAKLNQSTAARAIRRAGLQCRPADSAGSDQHANAAMFVIVLVWQAAVGALLWIAAIHRARARGLELGTATTALGLGLALWAAFVIADELFVAYESGAEATHLRIFTAQLVTLIAVHLLPTRLTATPSAPDE